jgi:hypothetical protein
MHNTWFKHDLLVLTNSSESMQALRMQQVVAA